MSVTIRKATIEDLKYIQELNYKLFKLEYNNFDSDLNMNWTFSQKGENYFRKTIENNTVWVVVDTDKVIGYLAGSIEEKPSYVTKSIAELDNFYVDEEYRRQGIGKRLVEEFKRDCINKEIEEIKVTANAKNLNAKLFYQNNGFDEFEVTYKMKLN